MGRSEATAFAPGHVTGFFSIVDEASDPTQVGSRGAGFSVNLGVTSRVRIDETGVPGVTVRVNGEWAEAATTRRAVQGLVGDRGLVVEVDQRMDLPERQGFGMSAAGALSATVALAEVLERPRREAVWAAHVAEVFRRTGLGDVVGADRGGFEVRTRPGLEPYGRVEAWKPDAPVGPIALAVVAEAMETRRILADAQRREDIHRLGRGLVDEFLEGPGLSQFVALSRRFSQGARLAPPAVLRLYDAWGASVAGSQCMLGGSVFVFGATPTIRRQLQSAGRVFVAEVDWRGARVTEPRRVPA